MPFPEYWLARPSGLPVTVGTNRLNWDLRYDAPRVFKHEFEITRLPDAINATWDAQQSADALRAAVEGAAPGAPAEVTTATVTLQTALDAVAGPSGLARPPSVV